MSILADSQSAAPPTVAMATPVAVPAQPGGARARSSTPRRLRTLATIVAGLLVAVCAMTAGLVLARQATVQRSSAVTAPLLVDAQTAYVTLSDADTTAAGALLSGPDEPASLRARYQQDIAAAAAAVSNGQRLAGTSTDLAASWQTLSVGLPFYTATVERAATNSRLGYPVAAAYQGEASGYLRTELLPAADAAYRAELARLQREQADASTPWPAVAAGCLAAVTMVVLVLAQSWLRRRFHRRVNVGLLLGTVLLVLGVVWVGWPLHTEGKALGAASSRGSTPLRTYTAVRLLALQAEADDELALLSRDSVPAYQTDFGRVAPLMTTLVSRQDDVNVIVGWQNLQLVHQSIRDDVTSGDYAAAVAAATDPQGDQTWSLPQTAARLDHDLADDIASSQARFDDSTAQAGASLDGLAGGVLALSLLALVSCMVGLRARLGEYR